MAAEEFGDVTITEDELWDKYDGKQPEGKILIKDRIADIMFQHMLLRPKEFDLIVAPNLNGDYLSDAIAAQVGGVGIAPGANIGDDVMLFEATHGTAPKYTNLDKVNPGSLMFSGVTMLEFLGWWGRGQTDLGRLRKDAGPEVRDLRLRAPDGRRNHRRHKRICNRLDQQYGVTRHGAGRSPIGCGE